MTGKISGTCQNLYGGLGSGKCFILNNMENNFKITKAKPLNDASEMAIDITCPVCSKTVSFEGSLERVQKRRGAYLDEHTCRNRLVMADCLDDIDSLMAVCSV